MKGKNKVVRKISYFCFVIALGVVLFNSLSGCFKKDYYVGFFANWEIELPENMKEEFRKAEDSWHGDGIRYAVFKLKEEPTEFLKDFVKIKDETVESAVNKYLSEAPFKVSKKYLPSWELPYYYKHVEKQFSTNSFHHCYMIYFPDILRLAICQSFV